MQNMKDLLGIMQKLRDPECGCPWDVKQNFASIAPYTIEEAYEVADAIERDDMHDLRDELGDLLLQVIFHAQMANEKGLFSYSDVVDTLAEKLIRRHPHVFSDTQIDNDNELNERWEQEKKREREKKALLKSSSALDGITQGLPALMRAEKIQKKASRVGFDWKELVPVINKIEEEIGEVKEAVTAFTRTEQEEEIGDLLFAVVNLSRHLKIDSETALRRANEKFIRRFRQVELVVQEQGHRVEDVALEDLERIWQSVKNKEC